MPLTFIDIERQKTWRIWIFFLVLMLMYFGVILAFAVPFLPHVGLFQPRFWIALFLTALSAAGIHFLFSAYDTAADVVQGLDAKPPDPKDDIHAVLINIMHEIQAATGAKRKIRCVVIPSLSLNALAAADLKGEAVIGITEGLLSRLGRPQLETVIAHETHHILSGDCLETTVAASLFGTLSSLVEKSAQLSRGRVFSHPALLLAWALLTLSNILNMFISRQREYRADAAAVRMTRNPVAMAETLHLLSRSWRGAGFIGSGFEMLCMVNPEATALDETEGFWADLISTHPPIQKRIDLLLAMAHISIAELDRKLERENSPPASSGPAYYAMDPRQQWQGPFSLGELGALPWLSPLTWVTTGKQQPVDRAWKEPLINAVFTARLSRDDRTPSDFTCPSCRQPLITESYEGTQIYQCRYCAGTLVESGKMPRILARTGRDRLSTDRVKTLAKTVTIQNQRMHTRQKLSQHTKSSIPLLSCPTCKNPMFRGFYSAAHLIEIDRCGSCGLTWFDQDELEMLQSLIKNS